MQTRKPSRARRAGPKSQATSLWAAGNDLGRRAVRATEQGVRGAKAAWFHAGHEGWSPRLYEWAFAKFPIDAAVRRRETAIVDELLERVLAPSDRVLELGSGTGHHTLALARRVARIVAVEPSPAMAAYLSERLRSEDIEHVDLRAGCLPEALDSGEQFDGLLAIGVLQYVEDLDATLAHCAAALRPAGWAVMTVSLATPEGLGYLASELIGRRRVRLQSLGAAKRALEHAGLLVEAARPTGLTRRGVTGVLCLRRPSLSTSAA